jgi:PAS domain S-box-containing protein
LCQKRRLDDTRFIKNITQILKMSTLDKKDTMMDEKHLLSAHKDTTFFGLPGPSYIAWNESGVILDVSKELLEKLGFTPRLNVTPQNQFNQAFKNVAEFFSHPTWDVIKELLDEKGKLVDYPIFVNKPDEMLSVEVIMQKQDEVFIAVINWQSTHPHTDMVMRMPLGACISTEDGKFLIANEKFAEIYGYESFEDMRNKNNTKGGAYCIYRNWEDRDRLVSAIKNMDPEEKKSLNFEFIGKQENGRLIIVSKEVNPRFYDGKIAFLFGYISDTSENPEERNSPWPVFKCDLQGKIIYANRSMAYWLGYTQDELRDMTIVEIQHRDSVDWMTQLKKTRTLDDTEVVFKGKDGSKAKIFLSASIIASRNGNNEEDVYIKGCLGYQSVVFVTIIEKLQNAFTDEEDEVRNLSIRAAHKLAGEMIVDRLSSSEIRQIVESIKSLYNTQENNSSDGCTSKFLPKSSLSLEEKIVLELRSLLQFFTYRDDLLKNAFTLAQVSTILNDCEEDIIAKVQEKSLLAIDRDGDLLFPAWQFDSNSATNVLVELPTVLNALEETSITQLSWLMNPNSALDEKRPCDVLRNGTPEDKQVLISEAYSAGSW